jgi:hypothetical protein
MSSLRLLLLLAALVGALGQQCYSSDCATCLSDSRCVYFSSCGCYQSIYAPSSCNGEPPSRSSSSCPTPPTAAEAARPLSPPYWVVCLAVVAVGATAVLSYSPLEKLCGQKEAPPSPSHSGVGCSHHLLFLACCFLWFGLSLGLAAPALPWLVVVTRPGSTMAASAFYTFICFQDSGASLSTPAPSVCQQVTTAQYLNNFNSRPALAADLAYAQNGLALGAIAYTVSLGLLLPCALMTSIAVYRLNKLARYGTPPYTSGCSPASLAVAQMLGWPAFAVFAIAFFLAVSLCATVADKLNSQNFFGLSTVEYRLMPGSVAAGVSFALQLVGLALQAVVARALSEVKGVGCNSGGCCRLALDNGRDGSGASEGTALFGPASTAAEGTALLGPASFVYPRTMAERAQSQQFNKGGDPT